MRGQVERRNGRWRARYRGPDRRERSKTFDRKPDAERWLTSQLRASDTGDWADPTLGRLTFGHFAEQWIEQQERGRRRACWWRSLGSRRWS